MAQSYQELFGVPILNDETYNIKEGFIRIWEVKPKPKLKSKSKSKSKSKPKSKINDELIPEIPVR